MVSYDFNRLNCFHAQIRSLMFVTAYLLILSGIWTFATYLYFGKGPILWLSEQKGALAVFLTIFEGILVIVFGIYILMNLS